MTKDMINGYGPDATYLSVVRVGPSTVQVVIGANYENNCASYLSKSGLLELIDTLKGVADSLD